MSFWDLTQFIAEEQPLQFHFMQDAPGMAFLDPSKSIEGSVPAHQPLHAPVWMVTTLSDYLTVDKEIVRIELPEIFHVNALKTIESFRTGHRGEVQKINFDKKSPYFYEIYDIIKRLPLPKSTRIPPAKIAEMIQERGKEIISKAFVWQQEGKSEHMRNTYSRLEIEVSTLAREKREEYDNWMYNRNA